MTHIVTAYESTAKVLAFLERYKVSLNTYVNSKSTKTIFLHELSLISLTFLFMA